MSDDYDAADEIGHDGAGEPTAAQVTEAYDALDERDADERRALREALSLLLGEGPDALLAAADSLRDRLNDDDALLLSEAVGRLHPEHDGVYWASGREGDLDA